MGKGLSPEIRRAIYGVVAALLTLGVAAGVIVQELVPLLLTAVAGVLGLGLAYKHTPTDPAGKTPNDGR